MPPGQYPSADEGEQFEPVWISPTHALERHERGDFFMIFPTIRTLRRLAAMADVDAVLAACASDRPLWVSSPRGGRLRGDVERFSEHEPPYGELEMVVPDGQILHSLDWQHERAVPLLRNVQRLTAPNPGFMTGPGTNTYLVGGPGDWAVIDPGPVALPSDLTPGRIRDSFGTPSAIAFWDLPRYIGDLERAGFSAQAYKLWYQMELALPLLMAAMVLVAAGFTMRHVRFGGTGRMVLYALLAGFGFYFLRNFAQALGDTGQIPVLLAAWSPPIAAVMLSLGLLLHLEDG